MSGYVFDDSDNHYALSCTHQKILQHCDIPAGELIGLVMSSMLIPTTTDTLVDKAKVVLQDYGIDCDHVAYNDVLKNVLLYCDMYRYQNRGIHIGHDHEFTTHTTDDCALLCVEENVMATASELYEKKIKIDFSGYRISIDQTTVAAYSRDGEEGIPLAKSPIGDPTSTSIYYVPPMTKTIRNEMVHRKDRYPSLSSPFIRVTEVIAARLGEEVMSDELIEKVKRLTEDLKDANKKPLHIDDLSYMPRTDLKSAKSIAQMVKACYIDFIVGDSVDLIFGQAAAIHADFFPDSTDFETDLDSVYQLDINMFNAMMIEGRITEVGIRIVGLDGKQTSAHSTSAGYGLEPIAVWSPRYSRAFLDITSGASTITYVLHGYFDRVNGIPAFDVVRVNNDKYVWLSSGSNVAVCSLKSLVADVLSHSYDGMLLQYLKQNQRAPVATTPIDDFDIENALSSDYADGVRYVSLAIDASEDWVRGAI